MSDVLRDLDFSFTYLDDIFTFSSTWEENINHLSLVFKRLKEADLKIKLSKCKFFKQSLHTLGNAISDEGIRPLPEKTAVIQVFIPPTNIYEVCHFLGLIGYCGKFIPLHADIAKPLNNLFHKKTPFEWPEECQSCFEQLKEAL